jgi:pentatricopeptide repeat protein
LGVVHCSVLPLLSAYCKKARFLHTLLLLDEMCTKENCTPTLLVLTTQIHGDGIVRDVKCACQLFDEMEKSGVTPDRGGDNVLMGVYVSARDMQSAMTVMGTKGIGLDDVSYNMMFFEFQRVGDLKGIWRV